MAMTRMSTRILVTGSSGLIGQAMSVLLGARGYSVVGLDSRAQGEFFGDVRDIARVRSAMVGCAGVVHLAAVSRVVWAERDPDTCWATNVGGVENLISAAISSAAPPWLIFGSSREVYGEPDVLPCREGAPLLPVNTYGRSKVEGERLIETARAQGLRASILRFSNVYGSIHDYHDRVVPAFARAAATGTLLQVEGSAHTFDFTHLDDTVRGIGALVDHLECGGEALDPIHLVTGQPTTLGALATLAVDLAGSGARLVEAPARSFDVGRFFGCPDRALRALDWTPRVDIRTGLARLIADFSNSNP